MELGNDDNGRRLATARIKAAKTLLSDENFAVVEELGGDVGDHVNKALEVYVRGLQGQESCSPDEHEPVYRQGGDAKRKEGSD